MSYLLYFLTQYLKPLLMIEYELPTTGNCDVLIHLVRGFGLALGPCLDVAMMNDKVDMKLLTQECPLCYVEYMRDEVS